MDVFETSNAAIDDDEKDMNEAFAQIILEQEKGLGTLNYGSSDDYGNDVNVTGNDIVIANEQSGNTSRQPRLAKSVSLEEIAMETFDKDNPFTNEGTSLMRRRVKSVKETSRGIEYILQELPSRTIGRKRGGKLAANYSTIVKFGSIYRSNHLASTQTDEMDAKELYKELATEDGKVDAGELRELPVKMTLKKKVRSRAKMKEQQVEATSVSCFSLWKFKLSLSWRHFKDNFAKFLASGKLWYYHLKHIEGDFGTGVLSYFTFLRAIFLLSLPSFFLGFLFISVPQLFDRPDHPQCHFTGEGLLTGANCLTNTIMYQGYYVNGTINNDGSAHYNMPLAFLLTTLGYFVLCLVWLVRSTGVLFRENYIDAKEEGTNFVSKVFCAWDFGIASQTTARIRHKTLTTELKEILAEQRRGEDHRTGCEKFEVILLRTVSWSFYIAIVGGSVAAIYFTNKVFICDIKDNVQGSPIFQDLALAIIVSLINLILPYIIDWITKLEKYKYPRHQLYVSVLRNFIFKMSLLAVICAFWTSDDVQTCSQAENQTSICWETALGQEIYRLIVVDFIFCLVFSTFCAEFLRNILGKATGHKPPEFSIANNVMDLIYGQTLCWIGIYFSPLLAVINMIKYFLLFYIKKISVVKNCRPSTERWRATQSQTLFNIVQLASFILSAAFLSYVIFNKMPSESCGPFRGQDRAYDIVVGMIDDMSGTSTAWLGSLISVITSVWILDAVVIAILVMVIFARNRAHGLQYLSGTLEEQIAMEGKDKALLLNWLKTLSSRADPSVLQEEFESDGPGPSLCEPQAGDVILTNGVYTDIDLDSVDGHDESGL